MTGTRAFAIPAPAETEAHLLVRCQRYEPEALADFFDRFHDSIHDFLSARTGDDALTEALTRETLLRVLQLLPKYGNRGAGLGPWLLRVANGRLVERRLAATAATAPGSVSPAAPSFAAGSPEARLRAALDSLPADQQEVVGLRLLARLPLNGVARAGGRRYAAARTLQHRALTAMANLVGGESGATSPEATR